MWAPKERDLGAETPKPVWEARAPARAAGSWWPVVSSTEHSAWHLEFCSVEGEGEAPCGSCGGPVLSKGLRPGHR